MKTLITFQNVTLIDGNGGEPLTDATVGVREGRIVYAGPARKWQPTLEEDIINLELRGKYVMPGLIDCHVHITMDGAASGQIDVFITALPAALPSGPRRDRRGCARGE